jgi:hypothetical protein
VRWIEAQIAHKIRNPQWIFLKKRCGRVLHEIDHPRGGPRRLFPTSSAHRILRAPCALSCAGKRSTWRRKFARAMQQKSNPENKVGT